MTPHPSAGGYSLVLVPDQRAHEPSAAPGPAQGGTDYDSWLHAEFTRCQTLHAQWLRMTEIWHKRAGK